MTKRARTNARTTRHHIDREDLQNRACCHDSTRPRPFLRWAGSKRALIGQFIDVIPDSFSKYYEPFLGSGALFFCLRPRRAVLSDTCHRLIATYRAVASNPIAVLRYLSPLQPDRDTYYRVRENPAGGEFKRAAEFIYLNKTCWNGLYRVNSCGQFNVPYGAPKTQQVPDSTNLKECAKFLSRPHICIRHLDFEDALTHAGRGDLVFLDPPYVTTHNNNGFIDYNQQLFSWDDQRRLARVATRLASQGAAVLVANADHDDVIALYPGFSIRRITRRSTLASRAKHRRGVCELLLYSI